MTPIGLAAEAHAIIEGIPAFKVAHHAGHIGGFSFIPRLALARHLRVINILYPVRWVTHGGAGNLENTNALNEVSAKHPINAGEFSGDDMQAALPRFKWERHELELLPPSLMSYGA